MFDLGINIALGDISRLQSDLNQTTRSVEAAMNRVSGSVARSQSAFQSLRNEIPLIDRAFRVLSNPITLVVASLTALGVGFTQAVQVSKVFEKQIANTAGIVTAGFDTEESQRQLGLLTAEARRLGSETEFSATQAAEAFEFLGRNGLNTTQILAAGADTLSLASVGNLELARAADIATNVLNQFQKPASELGSVVDIIAKATTTSASNVEQLAEAMKYLGPTAQALGIPLEEASATIGILANNGLQGSVATRALGTSLLRLASPTKQIQAAIDSLPLGLKAFNDETGEFVGLAGLVEQLENNFVGLTDKQKQAALSVIFGAEAIQEFNILIAAGSDQIRNYTAQIEDAGKQNGDFAEGIRQIKLDTFSGAIDSLESSFEGLQLAVASGTLPILKDIGFALADTLRVITQLIDGSKNFGDVFGPIGAALDRFFDSIQSLGNAVAQSFTGIFEGANGGITGFVSLIGNTLQAAIVGLIEVFTRVNLAVSGAISVFGDLVGYVQDNADVIALIVLGLAAFNIKIVIAAAETAIFHGAMAGAGVALNVYNKAQTAFNLAQTGFIRGIAAARGAMLAFNAVLIANPIGVVVAAISLLVAGIVVLYRESQTFRAIVSGAWSVLLQGVETFRSLYNESALFRRVLAGLTGPIGAMVIYFDELKAIVSGVGSALAVVGRAFTSVAQSLNKAIPIVQAFSLYFSIVGNNIRESIALFSEFGRALVSIFNAIRSEIQDLLGIDIAQIFKTVLLGPLAGLETQFRAIGRNVASAFSAGYNAQIANEQQRAVAEQAKQSAIIIADAAAAGLNQAARSNQLVTAGAAAAGNFINAINNQLKGIDATEAGRSLAVSLTKSVNDALKAGTLTQSQANELLASIEEKIAGSVINAPTLTPQVDIVPATGSIAELQNRLSELDKQLQATGTASNLFQNFQAETEQARQKVEDLKAELQTVSTNLDLKIGGDINAQLAEIDITGQAKEIGETLTRAINQALASGQITAQQAEKLLANLETKVSALNIQGPDISVNLDAESAQKNLTDLQNILSNFEAQVGKPGKDAELFSTLIGQANQTQDELITLQSRFDALRAGAAGSLAGLQARLGALNEQINRTSADSPLFEGLVNQSVELQKEIDRINEKLDLLRKGISLDFGTIEPIEVPATLNLELDNVLLKDVPNLDLGTLTLKGPDVQPFNDFALAMKSIGGELSNVADQSKQLEIAARALGLNQDLVNNYFRDYRDLLKVVNSGSFKLAESFNANKDQALEFSIEMERLKESVNDALLSGGLDAVHAFASEFGKALAEGSLAAADFGSVMQGVIQAFLVDITKLIGIALIKASIPLLPESLPVLLTGIALVGLSGLVNGVIGSLGGGKGRNSDLDLPDNPGQGVSSPVARGLAQQSADNGGGIVNNITLVIESDGIITEIQRRQVIGGMLRDGK